MSERVLCRENIREEVKARTRKSKNHGQKESRDPFSVVEGEWQVSAPEKLLRVTRPHNTAITHRR